MINYADFDSNMSLLLLYQVKIFIHKPEKYYQISLYIIINTTRSSLNLLFKNYTHYLPNIYTPNSP